MPPHFHRSKPIEKEQLYESTQETKPTSDYPTKHQPFGRSAEPAPAGFFPAGDGTGAGATPRWSGQIRFGTAAEDGRLLAGGELFVRRPDIPDAKSAVEAAAEAGGHQAPVARALGHDPRIEFHLRSPQPRDQ